jgi:hypothetical protein
MTFLTVLGLVAGAVAGVFFITIAIWACTARPVKYQVLTKKAEIIAEDPEKPKPLPPKEWAEQNPK